MRSVVVVTALETPQHRPNGRGEPMVTSFNRSHCTNEAFESIRVQPKAEVAPRRSESVIFLLSNAILLAIVALAGVAGEPNAWAASVDVRDQVRMDWIDDLIDTLDDLEGTLDESKSVVAGRDGPIDAASQATLSLLLTTAIARADAALDQQPAVGSKLQYYGTIDASTNPTTLADYAATCQRLALEALLEAQSRDDFDRAYVASRVKTVRHLIVRTSPHNYKTAAGITG